MKTFIALTALSITLMASEPANYVTKTYQLKQGDRFTTYSNGRTQDKTVTRVKERRNRTQVEVFNYSTGKYEDTTIRHRR